MVQEQKKDGKHPRRGKKREEREFEQRVVAIARVTRVMAGGKRMRFRACVVIGNQKGRVGFSVRKGADVSIAVDKAVAAAKKKMITVPIVDGTIPHRIEQRFKASRIILKPAPKGAGVISGSAVRDVLELAGIPNVVSKIIGTNNKIVNVEATIRALSRLQDVEKAVKERKG